jgi:hypothetical protein
MIYLQSQIVSVFNFHPMNHHHTFNRGKNLLSFIALFLVSLPSFSQNILDKAGLTASAPVSAAYGLRLLSTSYAGSAVQIRRSSDNATLNIGFTAAGHLDTATLKTFTGAGNGFVSIWYDQSGNALHLAQPTAINQPSLVTDGVVNRQNARPFIRFTTVPAPNALLLATEMTTVGHVSAVHRMAPGTDGFILGHTGHYYWHSAPPGRLFDAGYTSNSIRFGAAWTNGVATSPLDILWPGTLTINEVAPSAPATDIRWDNIGQDRVYHHISDGGYSELIIFPATLSSTDRQSLFVNQGTHFAIGFSTLPVSWLSFTAQQKEETILLKWQTATEQRAKDFMVQHSSNGSAWTTIASQPANGNSSIVSSYQYLHGNPVTGTNNYRILQTDLDGRHSYSEIATIQFARENAAFSVVANPVNNGSVQVQVNKSTTLSLFNAAGKMLWKKQFAAGGHSIAVNGYAKGVYFLKSDRDTEKIVL